ncbi:MAG: YraN family protein [Bacillota bacterium]|nr:YraN family protein [Bacillota bacterium]
MKNDIGAYKKVIGSLGEKIAQEYLRKEKGFRVITKNYTCPIGEIDIIASDGKTLVFVEVRTSSMPSAAYAEESIGSHKQKKLRQLASFYLKAKKLGDCLCRFDVVIVLMEKETFLAREIKHFKSAF